MKIEMNEAEMTSVFRSIQTGEDFKKLVSINGQNFVLNEYCTYPVWPGIKHITMELRQVVKPKSPQELSAEESVNKAEEALRAAKEVLNKVKEK